MTRRDKIRNEHIRGTTRVVQASKKLQKKTEVVRPCEENERAHLVRRMLDMDIPGTRKKKKRAAKPKVERCL